MNLEAWHQRFLVQADWTRDFRRYTLKKFALLADSKILELGCGTGAVLADPIYSGAIRFGIDLDCSRLKYFKHLSPDTNLTAADAAALPFRDQRFDLVFCHFLLLWIEDPAIVLLEMQRVLKPGGVLALYAEPDYLGRIDLPAKASNLGQLQNRSLSRQGANLDAGRQLYCDVQKLGLRDLEAGIYNAHWLLSQTADLQSESAILADDLFALGLPDSEIQTYLAEWQALQARVYIPTFYAYGRK